MHPATTTSGVSRRAHGRGWRTLLGATLGGLALAVAPLAGTSGAAETTAPRAASRPTITLRVGATAIFPNSTSASASISGGASPTGVLTLEQYSIDNPTCRGAARIRWEAPISNGQATVTAPVRRSQDAFGTYHWRATYRGDSANVPVSTACTPQTVLPWDRPISWPFRTTTALINRQYTDLLGRTPTSDEVALWSAAFAGGRTIPGALPGELRRSPDHAGNVDPATRLYRAYFLRIPDAGGLEHWIGRRRAGMRLATISQFFASSSEFTNRYGSLTDAEFVDLIYRNILGRPAEGSGSAFWIDQLRSGSRNRGEVMVGFSESGEYTRKQANEVTVSVLYITMLDRAPTSTEFYDYVRALDTGVTTPAYLAEHIIRSSEYLDRVS